MFICQLSSLFPCFSPIKRNMDLISRAGKKGLPPPIQAPWTATITGFGHCRRRKKNRKIIYKQIIYSCVAEQSNYSSGLTRSMTENVS